MSDSWSDIHLVSFWHTEWFCPIKSYIFQAKLEYENHFRFCISGSFHLIQTMFDEYMHYLVEMLYSEDITKYLLRNVTLDVLPNLDTDSYEFSNGSCFDFFDSTSDFRAFSSVSGRLDCCLILNIFLLHFFFQNLLKLYFP